MIASFRHPLVLALALILGGCAASTATNESDPAFGEGDFERVAYRNPGAVVDVGVGLWAWPVPMDLDEDGDMDLVVSTSDVPFNGLYLFENDSDETVPVFELPVRLAEGIRNIQVSYVDGDPVVMVPGAILQDFTESYGAVRDSLYPSNALTKDIDSNRFNQWKLVDYEGDGDQDILVGVDSWDDYGWDNAFDASGNWTKGPLRGWVYLIENDGGSYQSPVRLQAGGADIDVYGAPTPNMADFDGDGDLDLITGEFLDRMTWFENIGSREEPQFAAGRFLSTEDGILRMDLEMIIPVSVDWDGDGDIDLVVGDEDGRVALVENTGSALGGMPEFKEPFYLKQKAGFLKFGALSTPVSVDWDNDGDEDLIAGNTAGYLAFIENLDGGYPPQWAPPQLLETGDEVIRIMAGEKGSIQGPAEAKWGYTAPSVADWNGDGLKDILVNSIWGQILWYRNVGTAAAPALAPAQPVRVAWNGTPPKPEWNWWDPEPGTLATQWRTTPYAIDWNEDGLMDLVMLDHEGYLAFFERFEEAGEQLLRPGQRIFYGAGPSEYRRLNEAINEEGGPLRLNAEKYGRSGRRKLTFADWDQDGDLDLLVNSRNVALFRNEGIEDGKVIFRDEGDLGERRLAGHTTSPTTVDWNQDGAPDLLLGAEDGHFYYLKNR